MLCWAVSCVWLTETNQIDQMDQTDQFSAIRWPRICSGSDGYLDSCHPLYVGAEISETGCH